MTFPGMITSMIKWLAGKSPSRDAAAAAGRGFRCAG